MVGFDKATFSTSNRQRAPLKRFFIDLPESILNFGLNIFYSWQNMAKAWAEQKAMFSPLL